MNIGACAGPPAADLAAAGGPPDDDDGPFDGKGDGNRPVDDDATAAAAVAGRKNALPESPLSAALLEAPKLGRDLAVTGLIASRYSA